MDYLQTSRLLLVWVALGLGVDQRWDELIPELALAGQLVISSEPASV